MTPAGVLSQSQGWPGSWDLPLCQESRVPPLSPHSSSLLSSGRGEKGEKTHGFLSTSLPKCQIFLIKVRKRFSANIKASDISVSCFPNTASPIHEQTASFQSFPNVRHEQTSPGIQSNQKIKPGFGFHATTLKSNNTLPTPSPLCC